MPSIVLLRDEYNQANHRRSPTKSSGPTKSLGPAPSLGAAPSSGPAPSLGPTDLDPEVYGLPKRRACDSVQEMEEELARTRAAHLKASRLEQAAEEQVREATRALTEAQRRYTQASNVRKQWQNTLLVAEDALAVAKGGSGPR